MLSTPRFLGLFYLLALFKISGIFYLYRVQNVDKSEVGYPTLFSIEKLPLARMFIEDTKRYEVERTAQSDAEWDALVPGNGLIYQDNRPYVPSIFHQLRCLDTVRRGVVGVLENGEPETEDIYHHCVNYLREMVLCRGDLQLDPVYGKPHPAVFPHVYECKDWTVVYAAVEQNQKNYI